MEQLLVLVHQLLPVIIPAVSSGGVFLLVAGIKKLEAIKYSDNKKAILRPLAAVLSFAGVVVLSLSTGEAVDHGAITELVNLLISSGLAYLGATGIHEVKNG